MAGKYQAYSAYKESGVEWIGNVPADWSVSKLGYLISTIVPMRDKPTSLRGEVPWIRIEDFDGKYISNSKSGQGVTKSLIKDMHLKVFPIGTVLCTCSCSMGTTAIVSKPLISNQTFIGLVPEKNLDSEYLYYLMQASEAELTSKSAGAIQQYLSQDEFKALRFGFPSRREQEKIANFLDHETAKIDTLIEKQQLLIKLLKEKRQAVISHAVTKGLNPNAPMRDSGVEWLGEVPEHWEVKKFKFLCDRIIAGPFGSSITKDMYVKNGYKVYGQEQVIPNDFEIGDYYINEQDYVELARYIVGEGDILISCVGTFGKIAVFPKRAERGIINPRLIKAEINRDHNPYYLREMLKSEMVFKQFELLSRGGTMGVINIAILSEILAAVPPEDEQFEVIEHIKGQKEKFRILIERANKAVQLLQERREALISAAVTGKIDVRNWVAPNLHSNKNKEVAV